MTMHLMGPQFTTTSTRKRKPKKKTQSQIQAEKKHEKFLRKMGVHLDRHRSCSLTVKHPPYTRLDVSRLESDPGSNPGGTTILRGKSVSGCTSDSKPERVGSIPTSSANLKLSDNIPIGVAPKPVPKVYSGQQVLLGIATMHKSNMVPVFSKKDAEDIAKMRRG